MCGIAGVYFFDPARRVDPSVLSAMVGAMAHRGPDDDGYVVDDGVGLAMCRLSIIDVDGGHQPMTNEDSSVVVVQNGEIYNYVELARDLKRQGHSLRTVSDTEVLAHLYESRGPLFATCLNGMFAAAVLDRRQRRLTLVRDRLGEKPLYLYEDNEKVVFASEIKALLASGFVRPELNLSALRQFLAFNYVPLPLTLFKNVSHLRPAHSLTLQNGARSSHCYWKLSLEPELRRPEAEVTQTIRELLLDSVALRLRADVPVGLFLSGGIDSSAVAWAATRSNGSRLQTFSIGFPGWRFDETADAQCVAARFGTEHHTTTGGTELIDLIPRVTWHCDQAHGDASFLPLYTLSNLASQHVKVVLNGDGGDELFAGYDWHTRPEAHEAVASNQAQEFYEHQMVFASGEQLEILAPSVLPSIGEEDPASHLTQALDESAALDPINRLLYVDLKYLLSGNNLVKPDRMGMAHSVECRPPFLDHRLVEFAFTVPGEAKVLGGVGKDCLKRALASFLPERVIRKPKQMFHVPVGSWFREERRELVEDILLGDRACSRGILRPEIVRRFVSQHQNGTHDHTRKLRALLGLEIWCRVFLDRDPLQQHSAPQLQCSPTTAG